MEAYRREKNPESIDGLPALPFPIVTGAEAGAARARPASPDGSRNASPACTLLLLKAINSAQAAEHRTGFTLPSNYYRLAPAGQMFVLINLERITRGVPPLVGLFPTSTPRPLRGRAKPRTRPHGFPMARSRCGSRCREGRSPWAVFGPATR